MNPLIVAALLAATIPVLGINSTLVRWI